MYHPMIHTLSKISTCKSVHHFVEVLDVCSEPVEAPPPYSPIGGGLTYAQGPHATFEKNCIPKGENKSKNRGTSLAKMDKFITFR